MIQFIAMLVKKATRVESLQIMTQVARVIEVSHTITVRHSSLNQRNKTKKYHTTHDFLNCKYKVSQVQSWHYLNHVQLTSSCHWLISPIWLPFWNQNGYLTWNNKNLIRLLLLKQTKALLLSDAAVIRKLEFVNVIICADYWHR